VVDKSRWSEDVEALGAECRRLLADDRCRLIGRESTLHLHYAMAGLAHCLMLTERMDHERQEGDELVLRLMARAHLETWFTAVWLVLGGQGNAARFVGSNRKAMETQQAAFDRHNERIARREAAVEAFNATVERDNAGIEARNARTGEKIPPRAALEAPNERSLDIDLTDMIDAVDAYEATDVPLAEMAKEIGPLAGELGLGEGNWEAIYDGVYRSLSAYGAHPTMHVFGSYLDAAGFFVHVLNRTSLPSMDVGCMGGAIFLTALLAQHIFEARGCDVTMLKEITLRYRDSPLGETDV
jgi:hypothetical protein